MLEKILDPDVLKSGSGVAAILYGVSTGTILIVAVVAKSSSLRNDSRILAPILAIVAVALALIDVEFPRASQTLLPILYPSVVLTLALAGVALIILAIWVLKSRATRIAALIAAPLPIAAGSVLVLIAFMLAHARFCC